MSGLLSLPASAQEEIRRARASKIERMERVGSMKRYHIIAFWQLEVSLEVSLRVLEVCTEASSYKHARRKVAELVDGCTLLRIEVIL